MRAIKENPSEVKVFILRASDVIDKLIPLFDQKRVFAAASLKGDLESLIRENNKKLDKPKVALS